MVRQEWIIRGLPAALLLAFALPASAQSFRVQCPTSTITHPDATANNAESNYSGATTYKCSVPGGCIPTNDVGYLIPSSTANGAVKCQQISGGDGYATMADGTQTYMFSFGPLSGIADIANGQPGTESPAVFNAAYTGPQLEPGEPATTDDGGGSFTYNGAIGQIGDPANFVQNTAGTTATATAAVLGGVVDSVTITNQGSGYAGPTTVTFTPPTCTGVGCQTAFGNPVIVGGKVTSVDITFAGEGYTANPTVTISAPTIGCTNSSLAGCTTGHVDPRQVMDVGVMNGNIPAPLMAIDEDDEFFLTLSQRRA